MDPMSRYLSLMNQCVLSKNGQTLAQHMSGPACAEALRFCPEGQISNATKRAIAVEGWANAIGLFLLSELALVKSDLVASSAHLIECGKEIERLFRADDAVWMMPVVTSVAGAMYTRNKRADSELRHQQVKAAHMEDGARTVHDLLRQCVRGDKEPALLKLTNVMCQYYMATNKLALCRNAFALFEPYASPGTSKADRKAALSEKLRKFSAQEVVKFLYLKGRVALVGGEYRAAQEFLQDAFNRCPASLFQNKRTILQPLVAAEIVLGRLPREAALRKYRLTHFYGVIRAIRDGNVKAFDENLDAAEIFFIRNGLYTALESVRLICLRRLIKKVYLINERSEKVLLAPIATVLYGRSGESELNDVECAIANLIYSGLVKGYVSHAHKCLVLSRSSPFPPIAELYERLYPHI